MFDTGIVLAICAVIGAIIAVGGLITRYERRQTKTAGDAALALQIGAENEEALKTTAGSISTLDRDVSEIADRLRREFGETVNAMQKKINEFEKWSRDEFVHVKSFDDALSRMERNAEQRDERMEKRFDRIERKIDEATAFRGTNT